MSNETNDKKKAAESAAESGQAAESAAEAEPSAENGAAAPSADEVARERDEYLDNWKRERASFVAGLATRRLQCRFDSWPLGLKDPAKLEELVHNDQQNHVPFVIQPDCAESLPHQFLVAWDAPRLDLDPVQRRQHHVAMADPVPD